MRHLLLIRDLVGGKALAPHNGKKFLFVGDAAVIVNVNKLGREELIQRGDILLLPQAATYWPLS
jgi:hypothetical protein